MAQAQMDTFGFDKSRFVGIYDEENTSTLKPLQLPLTIGNGLVMVVQLEDQVSKKCYMKDPTAPNYAVFKKKYIAIDKKDLITAFTAQGKDFFSSLSQLVSCVGCRRSVEHLYQQVQTLDNSVYESICISANGSLSISPSFIDCPQKVYHLFYCVRPKLFKFLESLMHSKKNKRCVFHSLKMQKNPELMSDNNLALPKWCSCSIMDVWDRMCHDCHKEIATLECKGISQTMDAYLKKHRFCVDCKAKVIHAFNILTGEADHKDDAYFCPAIYEGFKCCSQTTTSTPTNGGNPVTATTKHVHLCCERAFIVHLLTQADLEMDGSVKERHAKTTDIAQEEVCSCLAIYFHQRLYKVWHQKLVFEQTWLTLLYLGIETLRQKFEASVEAKLENICDEFDAADLASTQKSERKRAKRRRKKKRETKISEVDAAENESANGFCIDENKVHCMEKSDAPPASHSTHMPGKFHMCLLDMLNGSQDCECNISDEDSVDEELSELREELLEFKKNKSEIYAKREILREQIRQDFAKFCNISENQ